MDLKNWLTGKILVYAQIGDMDACASFVAFKELVKKLCHAADLEFAIGAMNKDGKKILDMFELKIKDFEDVVENDFDKLVLIDTQPSQMPEQFSKLDILLVDHHQKSGELPKFSFWDSDAGSTTEVIYRMFLKSAGDPSAIAAKAILFGIISDTAGLRFAKTKTLETVYLLLSENKLEYPDLLSEIYEEKDYSEKMACLKAAQRLKIKHFDGQKILVISEIGGSESTVASKLMSLGADIVLVVSKKPNETRIVGRAKKGWNLAEIFSIVALDIKDSQAGGHPGAAVINLPAEKENAALSKIFKILNAD